MKIVAIAGPTASGKSSLALAFSQRAASACIVNADSRQVYTSLPILCACPTPEDKAAVHHYLYEYVSPPNVVSAGQWAQTVAELLPQLALKHDLCLLVGGSGLYFKALFEGLAPLPAVPQNVRQAVREEVAHSKAKAYAKLARLDPASAARMDPNNGQRIARALEIYEASGKPLSFFFLQPAKPLCTPDAAILLLPERARVHQWAKQRFEAMLQQGALDEVREARSQLEQDHPAAKTIGLRPLLSFLDEETDLNAATAAALVETNAYIKRQYTWFRHQMCPTFWQKVATSSEAHSCLQNAGLI